MKITPIYTNNNFVSFEGMPERKYPYELPQESFESQAETQMPRIREELKTYEDKIDAYVALSNLQDAIKKAEPHLDDRFKNIKQSKTAMSRSVKRGLDNINLPVEKLTNLLKCHAQSAYQQDKHDAIWLFNAMAKNPEFDIHTGVIVMADAFNKLDRTFDNDEIGAAEKTIKAYQASQNKTLQYSIKEIYGNGKNISFYA